VGTSFGERQNWPYLFQRRGMNLPTVTRHGLMFFPWTGPGNHFRGNGMSSAMMGRGWETGKGRSRILRPAGVNR